MVDKQVVVQLEQGLHARPATNFVKSAASFTCSVKVEKNGRAVDAKSILGIMSLAIAKGQTIRLIADGVDEQEAVDALERILLEKGDSL